MASKSSIAFNSECDVLPSHFSCLVKTKGRRFVAPFPWDQLTAALYAGRCGQAGRDTGDERRERTATRTTNTERHESDYQRDGNHRDDQGVFHDLRALFVADKLLYYSDKLAHFQYPSFSIEL